MEEVFLKLLEFSLATGILRNEIYLMEVTQLDDSITSNFFKISVYNR